MLDTIDDIRFRELVLFERMVELGTIAAAARELGLPKATASRWLALLEAHIGQPLFVRGARQLGLTDRGRSLHQQLPGLLRSVRTIRAIAQGDLSGGTLRISVPVPFGRLVGGEVIARFRRQLPGVRLEVILQNERADLLRGRLDLAIRGGPLPSSDLIARRLATVSLWLYASVYLRGADVVDVPLIAGPGDEARIRSAYPTMGPAVVVVDDRMAVRDALLAGAGGGVLPAFLGEPCVEEGRLIRVGDKPVAVLPVHAVFLSEQRLDIRVRALIEIIQDEMRPWSLSLGASLP